MAAMRGLAGCGAVALGLVLAGCGAVEVPSRAPVAELPGFGGAPQVLAPRWMVQQVRVVVPEGLSVSERDGFFPAADIVWRGDPAGDRHGQIAALFAEAVAPLRPSLDGPVPAVATITLARFHGVTERARDTVGGVYAIRFVVNFSDPQTGVALAPPQLVSADRAALPGAPDERALLVEHLTAVLARVLAG